MVDKAENPRRRKGPEKKKNTPTTPITPIANTGLAEAIRSGDRIYQLMVDAVKDYAIFLLDVNGYVASWNQGARKIKGYEADEIIGQHFSTFYPREAVAIGHPQRELVIAAQDGRFEEEGWRVRKDGSMFWANVVITAVRDDGGELIGFAKVTRDLTERREAHLRAIADARRVAKAESASHAKTEFLTAMSHELRTPLNAIGGYTELLSLGLGGPITDEQVGYLERIRRSQQHLMGIISDLLNFSKIEAGQLTYDIAPLPIAEVVDTVGPLVAAQATLRGVSLEVTRPDQGCVALADRSKVEQIVLNLLSNAIKFTPPEGSVKLHCLVTAGTASLLVSDTGVGIPEDKYETIFEPFVQLGRSLTSAHEGTGLGLSISRDLARAMKGDLTVTSTVGQGSTFTLVLPRPLSPDSRVEAGSNAE